MYDSFTHIMAGGKRVSAVKHITVIEREGVRVTFLNTLWQKGDGVLKYSTVMKRREKGRSSEPVLSQTS